MLIFVRQIADLQTQLVARWHEESIAHTSIGFLQLVSQEHAYNYLLWHEEDVARSREVGEARIAQAKRAIDGYNQKRKPQVALSTGYRFCPCGSITWKSRLNGQTLRLNTSSRSSTNSLWHWFSKTSYRYR